MLRARLKENRAAGIQHDPPVVPYALTESLVRFISASATLIVILYVMARIDGQLALIALAIWPGLVVTAQAIRRCVRRPSREAQRLAIAVGTAAVLLVGIHHVRSGLAQVPLAPDDLLITFIAPPWGDALDPGSGLDLRRTNPPVIEIVNFLFKSCTCRMLCAIQVHEVLHPASLAALKACFDWSALHIYSLNAPGHNHGLLIATKRWSPQAA